MSLGTGALKLVEPGNILPQEKSMATLWVATTSGIHSNQDLMSPNEEWEGWAGQKIASEQLVSKLWAKEPLRKAASKHLWGKVTRSPYLIKT